MPAVTVSQKQRSFIGEPIGNKDVTELAGIGEVLGQRLSDQGYDTAQLVLKKFLKLKKNRKKFMAWLKRACNANIEQQRDCCNCLTDWCDSFM